MKREIKLAKRLEAQGRFNQARRILESLLREPDLSREEWAVVTHRQASMHAINKRAQAARTYFDQSIRTAQNPVTKAHSLRDFGNFVLLNDTDTKEARALVTRALKQLSKPEALGVLSEQELRIETKVTEGFLARADLVESKHVEAAYATLRGLDMILDGSGHDVYQLANLSWIIDFTVDKPEKAAFIRKAITLAGSAGGRGNIEKKRELQALLIGGPPLRLAYASSRQVADFGVSNLKIILRRVL